VLVGLVLVVVAGARLGGASAQAAP